MTSVLPRLREQELAFCIQYAQVKEHALPQGPILPETTGTLVLHAR